MNELNIHNLCFVDFTYTFNKTRQRFLDVILREGRRPIYYSNASQKNHVWARWGNIDLRFPNAKKLLAHLKDYNPCLDSSLYNKAL